MTVCNLIANTDEITIIVEHECIVSILGRFIVLTNDITRGLSAEIVARSKKYMYD